MFGRVLNTPLVIPNKNSYHFQVIQVIFDAKQLKLIQMRWVFTVTEEVFFLKKNQQQTN